MATLKNTTINDTGYLKLPTGTDAQRPASPEAGMMRWNTTSSSTEVYDGTAWSSVGGSSLTANDILTCVSSVDGASSGLDADLLDGQQGTYYLDYNNFSNTPTVPTSTSQLTNDSGFAVSSYDNNFYANALYADNWIRPVNATGLYFESYGQGIRSVGAEGGQYGSVATYGGLNGWEGFSIGGRVVFMHNMSSAWGIYNDVNNEWMIYGALNAGVCLRYNNVNQLSAENGYAFAHNQMRAPIYYDSNNTGYYVDPAGTSNFNTVCAANYCGLPASGGGMCIYSFTINGGSSCTISLSKPVYPFVQYYCSYYSSVKQGVFFIAANLIGSTFATFESIHLACGRTGQGFGGQFTATSSTSFTYCSYQYGGTAYYMA